MRRKFCLVMLLSAVHIASAPVTSVAGDCASPGADQAVIFSNIGPNGEVPTVNTAAVTCTVIPEADDHYNLHLINPGATHVQVRYTGDLGAGVPTLSVTLNGLGFQNTTIAARRTPNPLREGTYMYDTAVVAIPAGPTAQGTIAARVVTAPDVVLDEVVFHTVAG